MAYAVPPDAFLLVMKIGMYEFNLRQEEDPVHQSVAADLRKMMRECGINPVPPTPEDNQ